MTFKRLATQMNDGEFIPLDEESTAEKAFDAFILLAKRGLFPLATAFCEF